MHCESPGGGWSWECISNVLNSAAFWMWSTSWGCCLVKCTQVPKEVSGFWRPCSWLVMGFLLLSIFPQQKMKSFIPSPPVKVILGEPTASLAFCVVPNFPNPLQLTGLWSVQLPLFCLRVTYLAEPDSFWIPLGGWGMPRAWPETRTFWAVTASLPFVGQRRS